MVPLASQSSPLGTPRSSPATEMETVLPQRAPQVFLEECMRLRGAWGVARREPGRQSVLETWSARHAAPPSRPSFLVCNGKDNLGGVWVRRLGWLCTHVSGSCCCDRSLGCGKVGFKRPAGKDHLSLDFSWGNQQGLLPSCQVASSYTSHVHPGQEQRVR